MPSKRHFHRVSPTKRAIYGRLLRRSFAIQSFAKFNRYANANRVGDDDPSGS